MSLMWQRSSSQHTSEWHREPKNRHKTVPAVGTSWACCWQAQPRGLRNGRMDHSPSPGMMPLGVQDTVRWPRWKAVNKGQPWSILKLVLTVKEEGQRGTPGSPERVFDSIFFWRCRFDFPSVCSIIVRVVQGYLDNLLPTAHCKEKRQRLL